MHWLRTAGFHADRLHCDIGRQVDMKVPIVLGTVNVILPQKMCVFLAYIFC